MIGMQFIHNINHINTLSAIKKVKGMIKYDSISFEVLRHLHMHGYISTCNFITSLDGVKSIYFKLINIKDRSTGSNISLINKIEMVSKPSWPVYWKHNDIHKSFLLNRKPNESFEMFLISTSQYGIISHFECIEKKIGGKVLVKIY